MLVYQRVIGLMDYITVHCGASSCFWAPALPAASLRAEAIFWGAAEASEGHSVDVGAGVVGLGIPENLGEMPGKIMKNQSTMGMGLCIKAAIILS